MAYIHEAFQSLSGQCNGLLKEEERDPVIIIGIILILVLLLAIAFVLLYNRLQRLAVKVEEAGSGIDVALEKRCDLLNELLAAVKKYLAHEYETLTDVSALRSGTTAANRQLDQQEAAVAETVRSIDREIDRQSRHVAEIRAGSLPAAAGRTDAADAGGPPEPFGRRQPESGRPGFGAPGLKQRDGRD